MTGHSDTASQVQTCPAITPALRSWRIFPGDAGQLRALRQWLRELLPPCEALDHVIFVASALAANAVCHTASGRGGRFAVEIVWAADVVVVAVVDDGGPTEPRIIEAPPGENGRGLLAIRELAVRTGCDGSELGRVVWADVPWASYGGPPPQDSAWDEATTLSNPTPHYPPGGQAGRRPTTRRWP
jgi:serine/threonine-protein kinase RsbW